MNFLLKHLEDTFACLGTEASPKPYKSVKLLLELGLKAYEILHALSFLQSSGSPVCKPHWPLKSNILGAHLSHAYFSSVQSLSHVRLSATP